MESCGERGRALIFSWRTHHFFFMRTQNECLGQSLNKNAAILGGASPTNVEGFVHQQLVFFCLEGGINRAGFADGKSIGKWTNGRILKVPGKLLGSWLKTNSRNSGQKIIANHFSGNPKKIYKFPEIFPKPKFLK